MCSSYSFFFIFPGAPSACPSACPSARPSGWYPGVGSVPLLWCFLAIPVIPLWLISTPGGRPESPLVDVRSTCPPPS